MAAPSFDKDHRQLVIDVINQVLDEQGTKPFTKEEIIQEVRRRRPKDVWSEDVHEAALAAAFGDKKPYR